MTRTDGKKHLIRNSTAEFLIFTSQSGGEGSREVTRNLNYFNLDAVISVGYRVNSRRATQFRQWTTSVLREFAIKGYVLNRKPMENGVFLGEDYFERLLEEIPDLEHSHVLGCN